MPTLHVLHTNDLHNRLSPGKAAFIRDLKAHFAPDVLLLDAGDAVSAGNLGAKKVEPILARLAETGYDAMAMGNRESHPTRAALDIKLNSAKVPVLAANIRPRKDRRVPRIVQEYLIFDVADAEVAVFGLAPAITPPDSFWAKVTDYVFDDPLKTGPGLARKLREQADLVIALTHIGYEQDVILAASPAIDLIIGGHTHRAVTPPEHHAHAWIAATEAHATHVGHLTVTFDETGITEIAGELIALP
jgi:2',3'-cyclic-nucleotide 2'-phosphodiesterase (5'-nucleotidase family)